MSPLTKAVLLILAAASLISGLQSTQAAPDSALQTRDITNPGFKLGIAWGMIYGFPLQKPVAFMPDLRRLGARFTKVNLFWSQIEPQKGQYNWAALDSYLEQLQPGDEALLALFSSSPWATQKPTWVFPPSPAKNPDDYYQFVHDAVARAKGRVRYFQNDSEANNPMFWSGTKEEYLAELRLFYKAVKEADPQAVVVLGGCDGLFGPPGEHPIPGQERGLAFLDYVLNEGGAYFDVFDIHLYSDPYTIPGRVEFVRRKMAALGLEKPIICTEYNGPGFFEFPANRRYFSMLQSWSQELGATEHNPKNSAAGAPPAGVPGLYAQMPTLAPETQMFMIGCPDFLERKLERLQARDLVIRNVLAFSAGVHRTAFWDLWHDSSKRDDLTTLLYGKLKLLEYKDEGRATRRILADAFQRMAAALDGSQSTRRIPITGRESIYIFEFVRPGRGLLYIVWERRDLLSGENEPPITYEWSANLAQPEAIDALGQPVPVKFKDGRLSVQLSVTPIFIQNRK